MKIQILGGGCSKCEKLAERAENAAQQLGVDYELEKITDTMEIANYGVMMTPALGVDGEVKVAGDIPTVDELKEMLQ
jgi:small redox-active disulfide protein 2